MNGNRNELTGSCNHVVHSTGRMRKRRQDVGDNDDDDNDDTEYLLPHHMDGHRKDIHTTTKVFGRRETNNK